MTLNRDVEQLLRTHFEERGDRTVGDGQVATVLDRVASHRQRPAWLAALRSPFMTATAITRPAVPRMARIVAVGILAGLLIGAALFVGGNLPKPQSINGLIVFGRMNDALGDTVVYIANPDGSGVRKLRPETHEGPFWSPDGSQLGLGHSVINADGSDYRIWDQSGNAFHVECWDWSPDGRRMLCEGFSETAGDEDIHGIYTVRASDGGDLVRLSVAGDGGVPGTYSPDGSTVAYTGTFDGVDSALILVNVDGTNRHRLGTLGDVGNPRWAPDGQSIMVGRHGVLLSIDAATGASTPLAISGQPNVTTGSGQWSPDGTRILFRRLMGDDNWDLFTMLADGTDLVQVTNDPDDDRFFDWGTHPIEN
jgi:WD40 repeat protein